MVKPIQKGTFFRRPFKIGTELIKVPKAFRHYHIYLTNFQLNAIMNNRISSF